MDISMQEQLVLEGLKMNALTKLNSIKYSNPLYYHLTYKSYKKVLSNYKRDNNHKAYKDGLESVIASLDDLMGDSNNG